MKTNLIFGAGLLILASPFAQAAKPVDPPPSGFPCCDLRSADRRFSDSNYLLQE